MCLNAESGARVIDQFGRTFGSPIDGAKTDSILDQLKSSALDMFTDSEQEHA